MIYRFGEYTLDSAIFELRRSGEPVAIEPQVYSLLEYLIENRTRVVSKDELISAVWNDRAISDTTLGSRIFAIRQAVGDTGKEQAVVRTLPRRGFRFVGEIIVEGKAESIKRTSEVSGVVGMVGQSDKMTIMPTLIVLPFKNSGSGLDEYFCEGLTDDIISNLTHFGEVRVIASGSSFQFKNSTLSLAEIAAKLNADYVVEGSVRSGGDRLRIAVQLVDVVTGVSIWADRYDREMADIFEVQDAVTHKIVASLGVKMQSTALTRALQKRPTELDAYDCLLQARRYTATLDEEMHAKARDLLEKAIVLDENYARAYALLANVYLAEHRFDANPRPSSVERALEMAQTAIQLDPLDAYAHCWLAIVHFFRKDNVKFEAEAKLALDLNPNDPEILADIGHYLAFMGEFERGVELSLRAQKLNPLHPGWYHFSSARFNYHKKAYENMLVDVRRISLPEFYWTHLLDAAALGQLGRLDEASASLMRMKKLKPDISAVSEILKWNVATKDCEHILQGLRLAGLNE